jgi:hypothetical protein
MTTATRAKASKTVLIKSNGWTDEVAAHVGSYVQLDNDRHGEKLLPGDDNVCEGWGGCDFRYPNPIQAWRESRAIACNVHVTGRTYQYRSGSRCVRVKVEWVGDCEPSTYTSGWLYV